MRNLDVSPDELEAHAHRLEGVSEHVTKAADAAAELGSGSYMMYGLVGGLVLRDILLSQFSETPQFIERGASLCRQAPISVRDAAATYRDLEASNATLSHQIKDRIG